MSGCLSDDELSRHGRRSPQAWADPAHSPLAHSYSARIADYGYSDRLPVHSSSLVAAFTPSTWKPKP
jgi:hypothetical protein